MGRTTNEKCWACSLLTATEARKLHGEDGDSCWQDDICHSRRSYYRQGRGRCRRRFAERPSQKRKSAIDNVSAWCDAISQLMQHQGKKISLWQLHQALDMPFVEVWLGLLHSPTPYQWEGQGEFYREARDLWIRN